MPESEIGVTKMTEGFDSGMLAGVLANKGVDPGIIALLNDKDNNWNDNGMLMLLFLVLLLGGRGWNTGYQPGDGLGVAGVDRTVVNEANYSRLLDAVGTNGTRQEVAIQNLANALNCDVNAVQTALAGIDKQLAVNQGSIINAIQSCCCNIRTEVAQSQNALQSQIAKCCCDTNLNVERTGNRIVDVLKDQNFQRASQFSAQTQLIQQAFCQQNEMLLAQFNDIRLREDAREIQALRDKVSEQRDNANTQAILTAIENKTTTTAS